MPERESQSGDLRILYAFILGLLGVGLVPQRDTSQQASSAATTSASPTTTNTNATSQNTPLCASPPGKLLDEPLQALAYSLGRCGAPSQMPKTNEVIIATIPDPDTISYANYANVAIESIMRAAESAGYSFDRHWLPWIGAPPDERTKNSRPRSDKPGVLIFRKGEARLAVFLVGESPTAGIHLQAFRAAVGYMDCISGYCSVKILGPTFSGSTESLRIANKWINDRPKHVKIHQVVSVVSGTATGEQVTSEALRADSYDAILATDKDVETAMIKFYHQQLKRSQLKIAVLGESGTDYSRQVMASPSRAKRRLDAEKEIAIWKNFAFPMQISRVREAFQSDPMLQNLGRPATSGAPQTRTELELKLAQESGGYDKIPNWAKDINPKSKELVLRRMAAEVDAFKPSLIELFATDVRDILFVGGFIRWNANVGRMVVLDNDVLYSSKGAAYSLEGSLSAALFPLFNGANGESIRPDGSSDFWYSSQMAAGYYHAARRLMGECVRLGRSRQIWLTVFSAGENWPVAILPREPGPSREEILGALPARMTQPGWLWILATIGICCCAAVVCWQTSSGHAEPPATYLTLPALSTIVMALFAVNAQAAEWAGASCILLTFLCAGVGAAIWWAACETNLLLYALTVCLSILATLPWLADTAQASHYSSDFRAVRALALASGVSPILPLIVAVGIIAGWAFAQRRDPKQERELKAAKRIKGFAPKEFDISARHWASRSMLAVLLVGLAYWISSLDTLENPYFNVLFLVAVTSACGVILCSFLRLIFLEYWLIGRFRTIEESEKHSFSKIRGFGSWHQISKHSISERSNEVSPVKQQPAPASKSDAIVDFVVLDIDTRPSTANELRKQGGSGPWLRVSTRARFERSAQIADSKQTQPLTRLDPLAEDKLSIEKAKKNSSHVAIVLETEILAARPHAYFLALALLAAAAMFHWYPFQPAATLLNLFGYTSLCMIAILFVLYVRVELLRARSPLYEDTQKGVWPAVKTTLATFGPPLLAVGGSLMPQYGRWASQWLLYLAQGGK